MPDIAPSISPNQTMKLLLLVLPILAWKLCLAAAAFTSDVEHGAPIGQEIAVSDFEDCKNDANKCPASLIVFEKKRYGGSWDYWGTEEQIGNYVKDNAPCVPLPRQNWMSSFKMKQPRADGKDWQCEFYPNADCTGTSFLSKTSVIQLGRRDNDKYNAVKCYTYYIPPDAKDSNVAARRNSYSMRA